MAARVRGSFKTLSGHIDIADRPEASSVSVTIDASSVDTGTADRDNHLRSPDFLDIKNFPSIEFTSATVRTAGNSYEVDGTLTIKGGRSFENEETKRNYHRKEIFEGSFERTILLPEGIDPEAVSATSKDGILEISIPKLPEVLPRKVSVEIQR